jgi:putative transposase
LTARANPYIEAHFKTLKYCPAWPGRFDNINDARAWAEQFFDYYNHVHRSHGFLRVSRDVA